MFCGIGDQFMDHHCHRLSGLRPQHHFGAVNLNIVSRCVGCQLAPHQLCKRYAPPLAITQQLVRRRHRSKATIERGHEVCHRAACVQCMRGDGANGREHVLDAMVEFGNQNTLALFTAAPLGE